MRVRRGPRRASIGAYEVVEPEDLTTERRARLRVILEERQRELEQSLSATAHDARPVDLELSIGRLSRVDALQQQHMALARRQQLELELQQARSAIARLESGEYGVCLRCGEPIAYARLSARPAATLCRDCQDARGA